jgi:hypothetical protein
MNHPIADAIDVRLAESLHRIESNIDYRPVKIATWGLATASVVGAVATAFGAVAAVAGAYVAVKAAIRTSHEGTAGRHVIEFDDGSPSHAPAHAEPHGSDALATEPQPT